MPFHSPAFLILVLVAFAVYYLGGERWQHLVLLAASLAFYYAAGLVDTLLLLGTVLANHLAAAWTARPGPHRRGALIAIVTLDLGVLALFKYRGLFGGVANTVFHTHFPAGDIIIPLGISFYVFQLIAYQVELSRDTMPREPRFWRVLLYILFFPHHQAGPIMRPATFLPQFYGRKPYSPALVASGGLWIVWGLCKKVLADNIALGVDVGFARPELIRDAASAWSLALRYALQIYGDFSGYSDIAVGLALLFGYRLDRNFAQPYLAARPSELWKRWHITLSRWLRDYLYIPLGGNRRGTVRTYVNLMLTMLLGGLWHGASLLFIVWGFIHGLLLVVERLVPSLFRVRLFGWALTFAATVAAWVPFRATSTAAACHLGKAMLGGFGLGAPPEWWRAVLVGGGIVAFQLAEDRVLGDEARRRRSLAVWQQIPPLARGVLVGAVVSAIVVFLVDRTTFIYFRF